MTIACPDCGTLEDIPPLSHRSTALCVRCDGVLESNIGRSADAALACSLSTLVLLPAANTLPLLEVDLFGRHAENVTAAAVAQLWHQGWILLAGFTALFVIVLPFVRFGLVAVVLGALRLGRRPPWIGRAFRWAVWLDPWAMLDVFLLAVCVGFYYLADIERIHVSVEIGGVCLIAAGILTMLTRATLDEGAVWRAIGRESGDGLHDRTMACRTCHLVRPLAREGEPCPRCGARIRARKRDAVAWTAGLLVASFLLLFPANIFPMNNSSLLGHEVGYTNFGYVVQLWHRDLWMLSAVTFWTSIVTPGVQILAVAWCVLSVWRRSDRHLVVKTRALRAVAASQRWSNTNPFAVLYFVPLIDFGAIGTETAGWGATAFMAMSVLTMAASLVFDPRRMWDVAAGRAAETTRPADGGPRASWLGD